MDGMTALDRELHAGANGQLMPWQLIPNSGLNVLKVIVAGFATVNIGATAQSWTTIPHNLGYTPTVIAYLNNVGLSPIFTSGNLPLPAILSANIDLAGNQIITRVYVSAATDNTNLYIFAYNSTGVSQGGYQIKYDLLKESAN